MSRTLLRDDITAQLQVRADQSRSGAAGFEALAFLMGFIGALLSVFSGLKGKLLFVAGVIALLGLGLNSMDLIDPEKGLRADDSSQTMSTRLSEQTHALAEYSRSATWGDAAIQIGLSFGIAMVFASLLRAFLKTMISFLLIAFLVCWFLHYRGLIDPFWEDFSFSFKETQAWMAAQFESAKGFVGGVLPSTGAAMAGFLLGLRK